MKTDAQTREADGKYNHSLDRVCVCGQRKGAHDAERPYPLDATDCDAFKAAKVAK